MANTVYIHQIINQSNRTIYWTNGENNKFFGKIYRLQSFNANGTGLCFPWVDYTKNELHKALVFKDYTSGTELYKIFQSYNRDTIQYLRQPLPTLTEPNPKMIFANNAIDVPGQAGASGPKNIIIPRNFRTPRIVNA